MRKFRSLGYQVLAIIDPIFFLFSLLSHSFSSDRYLLFGKKKLLAIAAMNAELSPCKNGEQNSESASTLNHGRNVFVPSVPELEHNAKDYNF